MPNCLTINSDANVGGSIWQLFHQPAHIVVAHPDDEVLWFGGLLIEKLKYPVIWDITVLSPETDRRIFNFMDVCKRLKLRPSIAKDLNWINLDYPVIISHNNVGEYGHEDHIMCYKFMKENARNLLVSTYGLGGGDNIDWSRKKELICMYDEQRTRNRREYDVLLSTIKFDLSKEGYRFEDTHSL